MYRATCLSLALSMLLIPSPARAETPAETPARVEAAQRKLAERTAAAKAATQPSVVRPAPTAVVPPSELDLLRLEAARLREENAKLRGILQTVGIPAPPATPEVKPIPHPALASPPTTKPATAAGNKTMTLAELLSQIPAGLLPAAGEENNPIIEQRLAAWLEKNTVGKMLAIDCTFDSNGEVREVHKLKYISLNVDTVHVEFAGRTYSVDFNGIDVPATMADHVLKLKRGDPLRITGKIERPISVVADAQRGRIDVQLVNAVYTNR